MFKKKIKPKKTEIEKNNKKTSSLNLFSLIIKIIILVFIIFSFYYMENSFSNKIALLSVGENNQGEIVSSGVIELSLKTKRGSGEIYVNKNTIVEIDTQISIINSHRMACEIFELNCHKYDFFYEFESDSLVLKGPSASSSIAVLTSKTVNREKINPNSVTMTGLLNSGGIIGNVGGTSEKIKLADQMGYDKVLIPYFSSLDNQSLKNISIEVIRVFDIADAYNEFNGKNFEEIEYEINKLEYEKTMLDLSKSLCLRSDIYLNELNISFDLYKNFSEDLKNNVSFINSSYFSDFSPRVLNALNTLNLAEKAEETNNYYSKSSFCYNANLNLRAEIEINKNISDLSKRVEIGEFEKIFMEKYQSLNSNEYLENLESVNDLYVYLLLLDRLEEVNEFIENAKSINLKESDLTNILENISNDNIINISLSNLTNSFKNENRKNIVDDINYAYALERFFTIELWEKFIKGEGPKLILKTDTVSRACERINYQLNIKKELLNSYGIENFNNEFQEQSKLGSIPNKKHLCFYRGLELDSKINTILNSISFNNNNSVEVLEDYSKFTYKRLAKNSEGTFPIIPYIYYEYSLDLMESDPYSSYLYLNYALSYSDIQIYLENDIGTSEYINNYFVEIFENYKLIILSLLILIIILL
jgi:predicted S18 family serine protease